MHIKLKRLIAYLIMRGVRLSTDVLKLIILTSSPIRFILTKWFSKRMINFYALATATYLITYSVPHIFDVLKLFDKRYRHLYWIKHRAKNASSASLWRQYAKEYNEVQKEYFGPNRGLSRAEDLYDKNLLKKKIEQLHLNRNITNFKDKLSFLRLDLTRNIGNIAKNKLHEHYVHIPSTILKYITEVKNQLQELMDATDLPETVKLEEFIQTRHMYGRTALLLSGGASLGTFHMGVVKALFEHELLPRILAGSSAGSIVASIICIRTDEELSEVFSKLETADLDFFEENKTVNLVKNFIEKGHAQDLSYLTQRMRTILGDITFKEAYDRTGRVLNITVCPAETNEAPKVLNYLTSPNVLIWSAVSASSAFPGLFPSSYLYMKSQSGEFSYVQTNELIDAFGRKWRDGSLECDLPMNSLTEIFGCNYFIVSQCSPHLLPILNLKKYMCSSLGNLFENEFKHICRQTQALLPRCFPTKWISLFTQTWEGDVSMVMPLSLHNPSKLIVNPTFEDLMKYVKMGERTTWENMWAIECHCTVEIFLDECIKKLLSKCKDGESKAMSWGVSQHQRDFSVEPQPTHRLSIDCSEHLATVDRNNTYRNFFRSPSSIALDFIAF